MQTAGILLYNWERKKRKIKKIQVFTTLQCFRSTCRQTFDSSANYSTVGKWGEKKHLNTCKGLSLLNPGPDLLLCANLCVFTSAELINTLLCWVYGFCSFMAPFSLLSLYSQALFLPTVNKGKHLVWTFSVWYHHVMVSEYWVSNNSSQGHKILYITEILS